MMTEPIIYDRLVSGVSLAASLEYQSLKRVYTCEGTTNTIL